MRRYLHKQQTLLGRLRNWIATRRCEHEVRIADIRRVSPELVKAECIRCGKKLSAEYGLVLPAKTFR